MMRNRSFAWEAGPLSPSVFVSRDDSEAVMPSAARNLRPTRRAKERSRCFAALSRTLRPRPCRPFCGGRQCLPLLLSLSLLLAVTGVAKAQTAPQAPRQQPTKQPAKKPAAAPPATETRPALEPKAIDILKAACSRLAAAHTMAFTAVVAYESPSRLGPPLVYTTESQVTVQRPDKLRVITLGDGPPSEFYYDGKIMMAYAPAENLVAIADAPPTIDAALKAAYDSADIYFPFDDVIVADPYKDLADGLKRAFYIGQSRVFGGTTTDMVAYVTNGVFVQAWIGAEDKLPRMLRAVYLDDPLRLRHGLELSNWQLDLAVPADAFGSSKASSATRIKFARPDLKLPPGAKPPAKAKPSKTQPSKTQPSQTPQPPTQ
jgi:hypothetical protein